MSHHRYQGSRQRKIRTSRSARQHRRQLLLRSAAPRQRAAAIPSPPISTTPRKPAQIPEEALLASLGCGNPTALAQLNPGETVLDLGSGGGIDVLLSARRVGPTGKAYGLDMTDEMLALANENKRKSGLDNVEFLKGEIEHIPLPDNSVDVIISNCVINLSADKDRVLARSLPRAQAWRPLRRLRRRHPRRHACPKFARACCSGSAASPARSKKTNIAPSCRRRLRANRSRAHPHLSRRRRPRISLRPRHRRRRHRPQVDGKFMSAFVRAVKPQILLRPILLPVKTPSCKVTTTFSSYAPETRPARSWPKPS